MLDLGSLPGSFSFWGSICRALPDVADPRCSSLSLEDMHVRDADAAVAGFRSVAAVAALVGCGAGVAAQAPGSELLQIRHLFAGATLGISIDIFLPPLRLHKMLRRMGCLVRLATKRGFSDEKNTDRRVYHRYGSGHSRLGRRRKRRHH